MEIKKLQSFKDLNVWQKSSDFFLIFLYSISYILTPSFASAVELYFEPSLGQYRQDDTFLTAIKIDAQGECINTVEANLSFPANALEAVDFSQGDSILAFWAKSPAIDQNTGVISFIGGIPKGYCGNGNNLLGKIAFKVQKSGENKNAEIKFLEGTKVLLNDGQGTSADLSLKTASFTILAEKSVIIRDEWQDTLKQDKIPPETFEIKISEAPDVFSGKYFVVFYTADNQTGIDHYEIKEGKGDWKTAVSPYLLQDQTLKSKISVKAIDKAGNEKISIFMPSSGSEAGWKDVIIIIIVLIFLIVLNHVIRKLKINEKNISHPV